MRRVSPLHGLLALAAAYRLSLLGRGAMAFVDEAWHYKAGLFLQALSRGQLHNAFTNLNNFGRPGDLVVRLVPAALQTIPYAFGIAPSNPISLLIHTSFNVAVTLVTLVFFYRLCLIFFDGDVWVSVTASAVYSLLVNTNIYVRHTLPYDWAVCLFVCALWIALTRPRRPALSWTIGALGAGVGLIYPGYYPLAGVLAAALVARDTADGRRDWWKTLASMAGGAIVSIGVFDLLSRLGDDSYFTIMSRLSHEQGGFTRGAYEGWIFLPRYLIDVERYAGFLLIAGLAAYSTRLIARSSADRRRRPLHWIILTAAIVWAAQAIASVAGRQYLFSSRVIHPGFLFMTWALGDAIGWAPDGVARRVVCGVATTVALVSWAGFATPYAGLAYPRDVLYTLGIDSAQVPPRQKICEMDPVNATYDSPPPRDRARGYPKTDADRYVLLNFCQGFPGEKENTENRKLNTDSTLKYDGPHFLSFPAYTYEGFNEEDRHALQTPGYRVSVYERVTRP